MNFSNLAQKKITIKEGLFAIVDEEDFEKLSKYKWTIARSGRNRKYLYARTCIFKNGKWKTCLMHRLITKAKKGMLVDHVDDNGLNNLKSNLRVCTFQQNVCRKRYFSPIKISKYRGVHKRRNGKFFSSITKNYKSYFIGNFLNEIEAAMAYNKKAKELFGEYARLNNV